MTRYGTRETAPGQATHSPFVETGQSVAVRINDRGPFVEGRIIDLSFAAAKRLGVYVPGTAPVRVEVLSVVEEEDRRSER